MLTNDTLFFECVLPTTTSSKLISKAPKCTIESFQLLLGAIDYINDNGEQETFPKLLNYDDTHNTTTEQLSNSNSIEDNYVTPSLTISDEFEGKSSEDETSLNGMNSSPKSSIITSNSNSISQQGKSRASHNRDDPNLICSCCKRDSSAVSFLKNYSIHSSNIDNYRNTFPDYDVSSGTVCMTCYHKQWRYSKGLYDPNKSRGIINKREGIQKSPSVSSSSTRKKTSPKRKNQHPEVESSDQEAAGSSSSTNNLNGKTKPRKIAKRRQNSSPSSNQSGNAAVGVDFNLIGDGNENQSYSTSTYSEENSQTLHHSLRLLLKFVWVDQGDDGEVYSCPINLDFAPTTLTSIKSLVIGKLKTKLSGYECDSIVWCHDNEKTPLTDNELQQKALRNDDLLIVNVK